MIRWLLVISLLATAMPAAAQDTPVIRHRVKAGDSLALLAAEYYGDRRHAIFIMVANKMTHPRALKPREILRIPMNRRITAKAGDSLETLAKQHLGDERRGPFLAAFNNLAVGSSVAVGQEVVIPIHVPHTAAAKEKIDNIAAAYFGDRKKGKLLKKYNFLKSGLLGPGEKIIVPINHVRVQASKLPPPDPDSTARVQKRAEMQKRARQAIPVVRAAWRGGDFATVKRALTPVETEYLDVDLAVEIGVLLGATYIAFGDDETALATFQKALERRPDHLLSAYEYSPKVRAVWQRAGGGVKK
ncbi:MAG: LysM peptidoglycan-binding domain-containing protein [Deltaproteobacteria bacterium]|nr:LysM peptidoglycan-binding domain-containing protein [Deltaproteobacteria bacterium]